MPQTKRLPMWVKQHWKLLIFGSAVVGFAIILGNYQLGSLPGGISDVELHQRAFAGNWHHIVNNPLNAPLTVVQWLLLTIFSTQGPTVIRSASVGFGLITALMFAYILRRWYGQKAAFFGTMLFVASAWYLHVSRYGGVDVIHLWAIPTLLAAQLAWERYQHKVISTWLFALVVAVLLYVPGMLWFIIVSLSLQPNLVSGAWQRLKQWPLRITLIVAMLVSLLPLFLAIIHNGSLRLNWLGLPDNIASTNIPRNLAHAISFFVYHGPATPSLWLDRLPVLDFFGLVMLILGSLFYVRHVSNARSRLLLGNFIVGAVFFAVQGPVPFSVMVPIIYLVVVGGIAYLLQQWLKVFPRNPLARGVGYGVISLLIALSAVYNIRSYFVAWPHNQATKVAFHNRL